MRRLVLLSLLPIVGCLLVSGYQVTEVGLRLHSVTIAVSSPLGNAPGGPGPLTSGS